jgi:hypothetical protein
VWWSAAALAVGVVLAGGCGGPDACPLPRHVEPMTAPRDACLVPPWVPAEGAAISGFAREAASEDGGEQRWVRDAPREPMPDEVGAVVAQHGSAWVEQLDLDSVGLGTCGDLPGAALPVLCIRVSAWICGTRVDQILEAVATRITAGPLADARIRVLIELGGRTGPRCAATDRACTPTPYGGTLAASGYHCTDDRIPAATAFGPTFAALGGGSCRHDGECVVAGCGNHCVSWDTRLGAATCEAYSQLEDPPALCGCVSSHCTWFLAD